ncbi:MAG: hypothetical protein IID48_06985 [Proteobacteria bacterium]|nr:hypothetical protein [Pseudomonadota bacterium]
MNDIPGLRLAPTRMIALVGPRGGQLESVSPKSTPAERHAAGWSDPRVLAAKPLELAAKPLEFEERTITNADATPAMQTRVARFTSAHSERMGDADDAPEREFRFGEFLDIINPLQHIPIVGTIYRAITGDEISPSASIFGGFLFGGPLGFVTAIANAIFEEASGKDLGDTVLAALVGDDTAPDVLTAQTPGADSTTASLEAATPTPDSQAPAAVTATASTTQNAGDYLGSSENLTGQLALKAFVRDLRQSEPLAQTALATANPAQVEISGAPALPKAGYRQSAARRTNQAAAVAAQPASPAVAVQNPPGMTETRAGTATQNLRRTEQSRSEPRSDPQRDNPGVPVAIQARAPDTRLLDLGAMGATLPASAFAERMSHALDKYQAIAGKGERNGNGNGFVLDAQL